MVTFHNFRFLQDEQQKQMKIFDIQEYDKILELAKLYSLHIQTENGCIVLNKTRFVAFDLFTKLKLTQALLFQ